MTELDPRHRELIDALRADEELSVERHEAILQRVLEAGPTPVSTEAPVTKLTLLKGGVVAVLLAGAALPLVLTDDTPEPQSRPAAAAVDDVDAPEPAPLPADDAVEPAALPMPLPPDPEPRPVAASPQPKPEPEPASRPPGVAAEVELMGRIRRAIQAGDHDAALKLLRRHERVHPDGVFVDERRVSLAEALCASGKVDSGRAVARAFVDERPDSPFAARARRACDGSSLLDDAGTQP